MDSPHPDAGPRSRLGALADQLSGWLYGLPPETTSFNITPLRIPVPEEPFAPSTKSSTKLIELASILYTPIFPHRHQGGSTPSPDPPSGHLGTILVRCPYGLDYPLAVGHARIYAARGYQVLLSACRGTASSTGEFTPTMEDEADGSASVLWMRRQKWYKSSDMTNSPNAEAGGGGGQVVGRWAMLGGSYLTFAQWATVSGLLARKNNLQQQDGDEQGGNTTQESEEAAAALDELKAMILLAGPHDWHSYIFGPPHPLIPEIPGPKTTSLSDGGTLNPDMLSWIGAMLAMEKKQTWLPPPFHMQWHRERMSNELKMPGRSMHDAMRSYLGGAELPGWFSRAMRGEMKIPMLREAVEGLADLMSGKNGRGGGGGGGTKVLIVAGWGDVFTGQGLEEFGILRGKDGENGVGLSLGPWTHLGAQGGQSRVEIVQWLDEYLAPTAMGVVKASAGIGKRKHLVRVFDTGKKEWLEGDDWPLKDTKITVKELFLRGEGKLSMTGVYEGTGESTSFDYDPNDPTPTIGSAMLSTPDGKMQDDSKLAKRDDVISFTTNAFERDYVVRGCPIFTVYHSSSNPFADLSIRISEVQTNGSSRNVSEGYLRLNRIPRNHETGDEAIEITMGECAHTFIRGTRLRLTVAGGSHPRWVRNLGTGEDMVTGVETRGVRHTVWHAEGKKSVLMVPVVE